MVAGAEGRSPHGDRVKSLSPARNRRLTALLTADEEQLLKRAAAFFGSSKASYVRQTLPGLSYARSVSRPRARALHADEGVLVEAVMKECRQALALSRTKPR